MVEDGPIGVSMTKPNIVNRVFHKFLQTRISEDQRLSKAVKSDFAAALQRLPLITEDKLKLDGLDPRLSLSFSTKTPEEIQLSRKEIEELRHGDRPEPTIAWGLGGALGF